MTHTFYFNMLRHKDSKMCKIRNRLHETPSSLGQDRAPGYLFPVVHSFYPRRDRGKYLVWDGL